MRRIKHEFSNDMARLFWLEKLSIFEDRSELGVNLGLESCNMILSELPLHFSVDHSWPDRDSSHIRLFLAQCQGKMVHSSLGSPVKTPSLVRGHSGARRSEDDLAL